MSQDIPPSHLPRSHDIIAIGVMIVGAGLALKLFKIFLRSTIHKWEVDSGKYDKSNKRT